MKRCFKHSTPWHLRGKMISEMKRRFLKTWLGENYQQTWWNLAYDFEAYIQTMLGQYRQGENDVQQISTNTKWGRCKCLQMGLVWKNA
jgi:hypothetical protein